MPIGSSDVVYGLVQSGPKGARHSAAKKNLLYTKSPISREANYQYISQLYILYYFVSQGFLSNAHQAPALTAKPPSSSIWTAAHLQIVTRRAPEEADHVAIF